jgi:two-component system NtrC family sensor kinase
MPNRDLASGTNPTVAAAAPGAPPFNLRGRSIGGAIRLLKLLIVASVVVPAAVFVGAAWYDWREVRHQATGQALRTAEILREHALKVFETHEFAIDQVDDHVRGLDWQTIRTSEKVHRYLAQIAKRHQQVNSIYLVAPDGRLAASSNRFPAPQIDLSDRNYVRVARDDQTGTNIGEPVMGRVTGSEVINVSRRRSGTHGEFDGVIVVAVSLERFTSFYRGITSIRENSVTLARTDGTVLSREPPNISGAPKLSPASGFMRSIRTGGKFYRTVGELDGIERFHAIEPVGSYPVYVSYGLAMAGLNRIWLTDVQVYALFAVGASIGLVSVGWLALRRARNEQQLVEQWQDEVHRREAAEQALRQTQKMEALGQLTGGVAHDFNNLLMVIGGNIELLKKKAGGLGADRQISAIERAAHNGEALTRKLLAFSRRRLVKAEPIALGPFVPKAVDLLKPSLPPDIEIEAAVPADMWAVQADADDLELALVNIVLNARDAMPNGGVVRMSARNRVLRADDPKTDHLAGEFVALSISDSGAGIPPEHLPRVFEPFFTTKDIGRGTGLGLSQVYGFAKQSGGTVTIESAPGSGTTVTLFLPRSREPIGEPAGRTDRIKSAAKVLLVEDNKDVAEAMAAMLETLGCTVKHAAAAAPALELLAAGEKVDLVLSDIVMPGGIDGVQLARTLRARYPALAVLLTTGYSSAAQKAAGERFPILLKPFQIESLQQAIGEAVATVNGGVPA